MSEQEDEERVIARHRRRTVWHRVERWGHPGAVASLTVAAVLLSTGHRSSGLVFVLAGLFLVLVFG